MFKKKIKGKRYMSVVFGDNDYGICMRDALERLWHYIHKNNAHALRPKGQGDNYFSELTLPEIFMKLHKVGVLSEMLERLIDAEYLAGEVESATRGLYWAAVDWKNKTVSNKMDGCTSYLNIEISFSSNKTIARKCKNGACAMLDIENGSVCIF